MPTETDVKNVHSSTVITLKKKIGDNLKAHSLDENMHTMSVTLEYYRTVKIYVTCSKGIDFKINMESSKYISRYVHSSLSL